MPYASKSQQRYVNWRASQGDPQFIKLARDFNQATYGRPGWTKSGVRTGTERLAAKMAGKRRHG